MVHSLACEALLKQFEGLRLTVGLDTNGVPSVGYGHDDPSLTVGATITQAMADSFLENDLSSVEAFINRVVTRPLRQGQFDALCDFVYNVGSGIFYKSQLLALINEGRDELAASDMLRFSHDSNGVALPGLAKRRAAESSMYLNG